MKYIINDKKYRFRSAFDTETGAYIRTAKSSVFAVIGKNLVDIL